MRKLLPWLVVLASACGGAATDSTTTTAVVQTTTEALVPATTTESAPSTTQADEGSGTVIPAGCAEGFIEYLQAIEPVVAFDPATTTMADFFAADSWGSTADGVHDRKLVNSRPRLGAECGRFGHDSLS